MEQLGSDSTDFDEIWDLSIFRKYVAEIQVSSKSDKNYRYFTRRPIYIFYLSRWFILRMRNVSDKGCRENQNTHFTFSNFFFFLPENRAVYEIRWKNIVEPDRPRRWQYGACAFHAGSLRLQTHTLGICNTYCFSTATMHAWKRLCGTLYVHCLSCLKVIRDVK